MYDYCSTHDYIISKLVCLKRSKIRSAFFFFLTLQIRYRLFGQLVPCQISGMHSFVSETRTNPILLWNWMYNSIQTQLELSTPPLKRHRFILTACNFTLTPLLCQCSWTLHIFDCDVFVYPGLIRYCCSPGHIKRPVLSVQMSTEAFNLIALDIENNY